MTKEINFETYLIVTKKKFTIFLFDKKNYKDLYIDEIKLENSESYINLKKLSKFLDYNIFKIEKLAGTFIKNIFLIIESDQTLNLDICIKKKNYDNLINKKNLENTLIEVKDLFKENYKEQNIMHMIIKNYIINQKNYSSFINDLNGDHLCLEINFISISNASSFIYDEILEKYQIKIDGYLDYNYLNTFFDGKNFNLSETANKIRNGYNKNEVIFVPKNIENKGFFEKFFQLFS